MDVSLLVSTASHMGFLTFINSNFPRYVLYYEMGTPTIIKLWFLATVSLIINYVPTEDSILVDPSTYLCTKGYTLVKC